jgi:putative Ca2+/H+ antiporter (TMEM165/GDT1 family)
MYYFWFGEVGMAAVLAGVFAVPLGCWFAGRAEISLAVISAAVLFLPLFRVPA